MNGSALALAPWDDPCPQLQALCDLVAGRLAEGESQPKRTKDNQARFHRALIAVCGVSAIVATARVSDGEGYPVSFANGDYAGGPISIEHLRQLRKQMEGVGLLRVVGGFHDRGGMGGSRVTRLHPTEAFRELVQRAGVRSAHLARLQGDLVVMRGLRPSGPEPESVRASRLTLDRLNRLNSKHSLTLPDEVWDQIAAPWQPRGLDECPAPVEFRGINEANVSLRRIFKDGWDRGGRLYGGWWQNVPSKPRKRLLIDGCPTAELDFRALHPRILYARQGEEPEGDPYTLEEFEEVIRGQGKRTFNRIINGTWNKPNKSNPLNFVKEDKGTGRFQERARFRKYVAEFRKKHALISDSFGKGVGIQLQCVDSQIALEVIDAFLAMGEPIYPVHDSFIVRGVMRERLWSVMRESSFKILGVSVPVSGRLAIPCT
ncbi:hypothetical protein GVN21_07270 [Caulobacter sp. SLTY]|uniref:hypothetical protein n=1 Tax=Caulobacter sp. SLTY TaxID=2683262 RepID=UPI0014121DC7|nr:hypothetical protein [Caulobacter sp. SLTY]NBB15154.1 hypothetical protein [Caulobacter sp. SLTY]